MMKPLSLAGMTRRHHLGLGLLMLFTIGALTFSQPAAPSDAPGNSRLARRQAIEGSDTVRGYQLSPDARVLRDPSGLILMRLPFMHRKAEPELMGLLRQGSDIELFLRRLDDPNPSGETRFRLEIFRGKRGAEAMFVHDFPLDGAFQWVRFFQPPDERDKPDVFVDVNPGSLTLWSYLLSPDRKSMQQLSDSSGVGRGEFIDLDGDGVYELIEWHTASSERCDFFTRGFAGGGTGSVPEIFVRGSGYREIWPPKTGARLMYPVDAKFADLRGDGAVELIVLQEGVAEKPAQVLTVSRLENKSLRLVAQISLPLQPIAFRVETRDSPVGKEILVRAATLAECKVPGANPEETGIVKAYVLRGDKLELVQP